MRAQFALAPALRILRGFALAGLCGLAATASAVVALVLVRVLAIIADQQPELFTVAVFAVSLWLFVRAAFRQREEF